MKLSFSPEVDKFIKEELTSYQDEKLTRFIVSGLDNESFYPEDIPYWSIDTIKSILN